jgi:uncharacterized protein
LEIDADFGLFTIRDVLKELEKPGRDPRPEFKIAQFKEGVEDIKDVHEGMILEGVVSNVTNFGAFVDIGVHQDGLVHISAMTNKFISDPRDIVKAGDIVTVRVVEVDKARRRIGLSMKLEKEPVQAEKVKIAKVQQPQQAGKKPDVRKQDFKKKPDPIKKVEPVKQKSIFNTAMADALSKLKRSGEK